MTAPDRSDGAPWRNFYGRRKGRKLRSGQQSLMQDALERITPKGIGWEENPDRTPLNLRDVFGDDRPVWLEIGFGAGEHMLALAAANPHIGFIGCEPYINGVATLMANIERAGLTNIRLQPGDARDVMDVLPAASVSRAFLLYPDPWPKTRHHRRRFINAENIDPLTRALRPEAMFHVATDIEDYVRHTLEHMMPRSEYSWQAERSADWQTPWSDWHRTRYEAKAIREGRTPHYLTFKRQ